MAFKMNKAAFSFGKGTGSSRLTKTPLYKLDSPDEFPIMGDEKNKMDKIAREMYDGEPNADMDAVVATPKMEEKRNKKKEREANKKAKEEKRDNKKLARLDKKKARIEFGKDSDEFKAADANLDSKKTGQNKIKAKVEETKGKVKAKVEDIKTNVKDTVGKVKKKYTKSDEEKELKQKQNLAKLKRKNSKKYKALEDASKMAASSFTKNPSAAVAMGAGKKMKK